MKRTEDILSKLLLRNNDDWEIESVTCDDSNEEIHVYLKYRHSTVDVEGKDFPILDFRHERSWRHLDMWQYKTILDAKIPRYRDGEPGQECTCPVGIAQLPHVVADGKKTIETLRSTKNRTKTARLLRLSFEQVHGACSGRLNEG